LRGARASRARLANARFARVLAQTLKVGSSL
jgi:hypothetical protein